VRPLLTCTTFAAAEGPNFVAGYTLTR